MRRPRLAAVLALLAVVLATHALTAAPLRAAPSCCTPGERCPLPGPRPPCCALTPVPEPMGFAAARVRVERPQLEWATLPVSAGAAESTSVAWSVSSGSRASVACSPPTAALPLRI